MALYVVDVIKNEIIGEIKEIPSLSAEPENVKCLMAAEVGAGIPMEFTATVDRRTLLSLLTGKHITNNYLKYHGGVMVRKRCSNEKANRYRAT